MTRETGDRPGALNCTKASGVFKEPVNSRLGTHIHLAKDAVTPCHCSCARLRTHRLLSFILALFHAQTKERNIREQMVKVVSGSEGLLAEAVAGRKYEHPGESRKS